MRGRGKTRNVGLRLFFPCGAWVTETKQCPVGTPQWHCVEQILVETPIFYWQFEHQGSDHSSAQGNAQCHYVKNITFYKTRFYDAFLLCFCVIILSFPRFLTWSGGFHAKGMVACSRWLSAATPPENGCNLLHPRWMPACFIFRSPSFSLSPLPVPAGVRSLFHRAGGVAALNHRLHAVKPPA